MNLAWLPSFLAPSTGARQLQPIDEEDSEEDEDDVFEMVQSYGIVQPSLAEPGANTGGEQSALLGGDRDTSNKRLVDGHASIVSSISNLSNTIIGSGGCPFLLLFTDSRAHQMRLMFRNAHVPHGMSFTFGQVEIC